MDADRDPVIRLVAANVPDELQDGLDGRGDVVVRPVSVVEMVDGAGCLQEKSSGRVRDISTARRAGFLLHPHLHQQAKGRAAVCSWFCCRRCFVTFLASLTRSLICHD